MRLTFWFCTLWAELCARRLVYLSAHLNKFCTQIKSLSFTLFIVTSFSFLNVNLVLPCSGPGSRSGTYVATIATENGYVATIATQIGHVATIATHLGMLRLCATEEILCGFARPKCGMLRQTEIRKSLTSGCSQSSSAC